MRRQTPKPRIAQIKEKSVVFCDGTEEVVDTIIYCTGYKLTLPFLDEELSPIRSQRQDITAVNSSSHENFCGDKTVLFRRVIHPDYPSLAFIGSTFLRSATTPQMFTNANEGLVDVHLFSVFPVSEVYNRLKLS